MIAWQRAAVVVWAVVGTAACGRALFYHHPRHRGVYEVYAKAGRDWAAGRGLYTRHFSVDSFAYSPPVAALLAPFGALPDVAGSFLWRVTLCGLFLWALGRWADATWPVAPDAATRAKLFLLVLPVTGPTLVNGQAGALVVALLLLAVAEAAAGRWWSAAVCAVVPGLVKVYPLAIGLLTAAAYPRRFAGRLLAALAGCVALSFLLQRPDYVAAQYAEWFRLLRTADASTWYRGDFNCDLQLLLTVWARPLAATPYAALQLALAAGAAGLCAAARHAGWDRRAVLTAVLGLGGLWMTLVGPAVESFTYILIGPSLARLLLDDAGGPRLYRAMLWASWGLFAAATLAFWTPYGSAFRKLGPHPLAGLLLAVCLLARVVIDLRRSLDARSHGEAPARAA